MPAYPSRLEELLMYDGGRLRSREGSCKGFLLWLRWSLSEWLLGLANDSGESHKTWAQVLAVGAGEGPLARTCVPPRMLLSLRS